MGAVQRIAGLERDRAVPAFRLQQLADLARREHVLAELRMLGLRQDVDRSAQQVRLVGVALEHHVGAGVIGAIGEIDRLQIAGFIPGKNIAQFQRADDLAGGIDESHFLARLSCAASSAVTGNATGIVQA